jgi:hypothetical protein
MPKKSTISALLALGLFSWLFCLGLDSPVVYCLILEAGIACSSAVTVFYWRKERILAPKASPVGIWILFSVLLLFILLCLVMPAL